jgi:HEAT repeat protein
MSVHSSSRRLRFAILATGALALAPANPRLVAQTQPQTRQVPVESLLYDLKNPDPVRRQAAARSLGLVKHRPATPDLVAMAQDPVASVRREVELSLESMDDMRSVPGFVTFAADTENDIRARAVASLINLHVSRERGLTAALAKFGDLVTFAPDRDLELVVEPDVPVDPIVVETLRGRIGDTERGIRRSAIRGLGILRAKAAIPDLLQELREDRDDGLRFETVRSIRKIADASIGNQLVALLEIQSDAVRNELIATLGSMRYRGAVPELTRIVEQAKRTDLPRVLALSALADIADPASVPVFEQFTADKNEALRLYASEGIARTADAQQKSAISAARLIDKSPRVRTAQAFGLLRIGEIEFLDELMRALERPATRELAKEYLLETKPANRHALFAARSNSAAARAELADVLGRMGDPDALPRLQELAHDSDGDVARAAELAVRRLAANSSNSGQ